MLSYIDAFSLKDRVAVITGGGSGLGLAMAKCLASAGAKIIIIGRRLDVLKAAVDEIGHDAEYIPFDINETDKVEGLLNDIVKRHGKIDILINNAGRQIKKYFEDMSLEEFDEQLNTNLRAVFSLTKEAVKYMKKQGKGSVIFVSSMSGFIGLTQMTGYSVSKTGILGMVRTLASELSGSGIRFNAIAPGFIDTPMFQKATANDPERQRKILSRTPMNQFGTPMDIGWAALYLASDASSFVTGTCLTVDGGCVTGF